MVRSINFSHKNNEVVYGNATIENDNVVYNVISDEEISNVFSRMWTEFITQGFKSFDWVSIIGTFFRKKIKPDELLEVIPTNPKIVEPNDVRIVKNPEFI